MSIAYSVFVGSCQTNDRKLSNQNDDHQNAILKIVEENKTLSMNVGLFFLFLFYFFVVKFLIFYR